jgi:hypothetical protein
VRATWLWARRARRDFRRHPQEQDLGGDRSFARRRGPAALKGIAPSTEAAANEIRASPRTDFFVVEQNRVLKYAAAEFHEGQDVAIRR